MAILETRDIITVTAGENITAEQYCFILHPDAPYTYLDGATAGRAYLADKSKRHCSINANLAGFALDTVSAGSPVRIKREGNLGGFEGLIPGQMYQPTTTPGSIEIFENHRSALPYPIAQAISATELLILKQSWAVRGKGFFYGLGFSNVLSFSDEIMASMTLPTVSRNTGAAGASSLKTYYVAGYNAGYKDTIDALSLSSNIFAAVGVTTVAKNGLSAFCSASKLYVGGGSPAGGQRTDVIEAESFATEGNSSSLAAVLSAALVNSASSSLATKGYTQGGALANGTNVSSVDALVFASETNGVLAGAYPFATGLAASTSSASKIFRGGGLTGTTYYADICSMAQSTETWSTLGATLSSSRNTSQGATSSALRAYWIGGNTGSAVSTGDSLLFSTEIATLSTSLLSAQSGLAASSS